MNENMTNTRTGNGVESTAKPQAASAKPQAATDGGRDAQGRFTTGNKGGPGNPFARETAAYRKAMRRRVTEENIEEITAMLLYKAKTGDLAAAKMVLTFCVGKPTETVDPDRLDVEEWKLMQESTTSGDCVAMLKNPSIGALMPFLQAVIPILSEAIMKKLMETILNPEKARAELRQKEEAELYDDEDDDPRGADATPLAKPEDGAPEGNDDFMDLVGSLAGMASRLPRANGANGSNGHHAKGAPSRNGKNGRHRPSGNGRNGKKVAGRGR